MDELSMNFDEILKARANDIWTYRANFEVTASKAHAKKMCMSVEDFLKEAKESALRHGENCTIIAEYDELNDMLLIHLADSGDKETIAVAIPRNPSTPQEELILASATSTQGLLSLESALKSFVLKKTDKEEGRHISADDISDSSESESDKAELLATEKMAENSDISDDEIEVLAAQLDRLTSKANNVHEAYMIELAVEQLRSLKGE
jgi:hypothetical protein